MYTLYHFCLCPFSRKIRVALSEKNIDFKLIEEKFWERRKAFIQANPMGSVPLLVVPANELMLIYDSDLILEFLEEIHLEIPLISQYDLSKRMQIKKLCKWFDEKFFAEVVRPILYEKVINYLKFNYDPDQEYIRAAHKNFRYHMDYLSYLIQDKNSLLEGGLNYADITGACHISVLDYLGEVDWESCPPNVKEWYYIVKSRPSFSNILNDVCFGFTPSKNYKSLDW